MSHPMPNEEDDLPTLKPRPRSTFQLGGGLTPLSSTPPTPNPESTLFPGKGVSEGTSTPSRTRSILNLTSSTLFGIYSQTPFASEREESSTPWGTGAESPAYSRNGSFEISRADIPDLQYEKDSSGVHIRRRSTATRPIATAHRRGFTGKIIPVTVRNVILAAVGALYGLLVKHLHDHHQIAPVPVEGINRTAWGYFALWAASGALLGQALPYLDSVWERDTDQPIEQNRTNQNRSVRNWNEGVRAITAFVGVAFAIRKLPWQSTLQLSLTLALVNPAIWYLIDRTAAGFILATIVSVGGTAILLGVNPALVPTPSPAQIFTDPRVNGTTSGVATEDLILGVFSLESITWVASVLFVSSVCFGNVGRRLMA